MIGTDGDLPQLFDVYNWLGWAFGPTVLALLILAVLRLRRFWRGQRRASDGIARTTGLGGSLPPEIRLLAGAGGSQPAHETLDEKFLRPTIGLRFVSLGLPVLAWFLLGPMLDAPGLVADDLTPVMVWLLAGALAYAVAYINTYQLRYDSYRFAHRSLLFTTREFVWKDLLSIRDDGAYFYVVRDIKAGKAYIPKYLTGIDGFLTEARARITKNNAT